MVVLAENFLTFEFRPVSRGRELTKLRMFVCHKFTTSSLPVLPLRTKAVSQRYENTCVKIRDICQPPCITACYGAWNVIFCMKTNCWFIRPCHVRFLDDIPPSVNTPNLLPRCPISVIVSTTLANYSRSRHLSRQVHRSSRLLHAVDLYVSATYCEPTDGLEGGCQVAA